MNARRGRSDIRIAIIGGGLGGIGSAVKLKMAGFTDFVIYEKENRAGGTWAVNTYPGCEVDIPSHSYSFSFMPWDWSRAHARQADLLSYIDAVLDRYDLTSHFRFDTIVNSVAWQDESFTYRIVTDRRASAEYDVVVAAVGLLGVPRLPEWAGLEQFGGPAFHTARWNHNVDLRGKRVAIVGTGSTAAQVVPEVAEIAEQLYVFQREPGWINAKNDRDFSPLERSLYRLPLAARIHRFKIFYDNFRRFSSFDVSSRSQVKTRAESEAFIQRQIPDPALARAVTPTYPWGCKRPVLSDTFYSALLRENVTLVAAPVTNASRYGLMDANGAQHTADVLILATGFRTTEYLEQLEISGQRGVKLQEYWSGRPRAYLGVTIPQFPNLFLIYGPNTNGGGSIIAQEERQAEVLVWALKRMVRRRASLVETTPKALEHWINWIDHKLGTDASAMEAGCGNYYHSSVGANTTQWPGTHLRYLVMTKLWRRRGIEIVRGGA